MNNVKHVLVISQDELAESPREWDNLGKMYCEHRRYDLGDNLPLVHGASSWDEVSQILHKEYDIAVILPLYLLDHSGITISTEPFSCQWDSGQVGWVFADKADIRKEFDVQRINKKLLAKVTEVLHTEVKTYCNYLMGNVYRYTTYNVSSTDEGEVTVEILDSCGGFYGSSNPETNGMAEHLPLPISEYEIRYEG